MPAYTDSIGFNKGTAATIPAYQFAGYSKIELDLNFAAIAAARTAAGVAQLVATDTLQLFSVPAGTLVLSVAVQVTTAEGAVATIDIGDAASATRFLSNVNLNSVAYTSTVTPFFYAAETPILMTIDSNSTDVAVCRVVMAVVDMT